MLIMTELNQIFSYKGAVYPVSEDARCPSTFYGYHTLVDIAAAKIVQDSTTTLRAVDIVPKELCHALMKAAVCGARDRAIEALIARWPWLVLSLAKFAPPLFEDFSVIYDHNVLGERIRRGLKYTTSMTHTFVECLKKRCSTKLKCLDITGYPTAEVIVNYLASHVLLVYNESRQKEIIHMYNQVTQDLPPADRHQYSLDATLPEESYIIQLDAYLHTEDTHMELCRALQTSREPECQFRLRLCKLDAVSLGVARIAILLEIMETEYLNSLSLQYNNITNAALDILGPAISKFTMLSGLDLSCNNLRVSDEDTVANMGAMLSCLPQLTRLDLSNNRTKGHLGAILSRISQPLRFLRICGCGASASDLLYLSHSHHNEQLRELDISNNYIIGALPELKELLTVLGPHLIALEIEETEIHNDDLLEVARECGGHMKVLRYLNIANNLLLDVRTIQKLVPFLAEAPNVQVVKVSCPTECYISIEPDEVEMEKLACAERVAFFTRSLCEQMQRPFFTMHFS